MSPLFKETSVSDMAFELLELGDGSVSLEFSEDDLPTVRDAINALFGPIKSQKWFVHDNLRLGGSTITYYHEWEDLCLIASDELGIANLKHLFAQLSNPTD